MFYLAEQFPTSGDAAFDAIKVINVLIVLLGLAVLLKHLWKKESTFPNPVETKKAPEWIERREFDSLRQDHLNLAQRVETVHADLLKAGEERAVKLHERLNFLVETMAEVRGRTEALTDALTERDPVTHKTRARKPHA